MPRRMPREPPVTIATCPASSPWLVMTPPPTPGGSTPPRGGSCCEHLAGVGESVDVARRERGDLWSDPRDEARKNAAGTGLEGERRAEPGEDADGLLPADGRRHLAHEEAGDLRRAPHRSRLDARHDRYGGVAEPDPGEVAREPRRRRLHQGTVEGR